MKALKVLIILVSALGVTAFVKIRPETHLDLPNRIPEAAPYVLAETAAFPPPYEEFWQTQAHPGQCQNCHQKIFDEWNGSMMSNSWRDPVWRAAFLLLSRGVSTDGHCGVPQPPDGTPKAAHNPFAKAGECASEFNIGTAKFTVSRPGSLLDAFCSRCHMPTNYLDNVPLRNIKVDPVTGIEHAPADTNFNPTSDNGTGIAFATLESQFRNTESGKTGIFCQVCHSMAETRDTPFHNYEPAPSLSQYSPAVGAESRHDLLPAVKQDMFAVADPTKRNLGYSVGAGAYRLSPHAIGFGERFGPLTANDAPTPLDKNTSTVFGQDIPYQKIDPTKHRGYHQTMFVRAEMCATCHDVTNALPIKNKLGKWVGGFPIERTYTEWSNSRYADRPGNTKFDPNFKRDCQSCHMQQDYGQPGTAQTLYDGGGKPLPALQAAVANEGKQHTFFTHHFVGGNALVPRMIGKDVDNSGNVSPYPELSTFSFSSADHKSPYSRGFWTKIERKGTYAQQARMAWDRLRHVLSMDLKAPAAAAAGSTVPLSITVANTGSGHDFPTGFPEGRTAWLAVHAYDLATGKELAIRDSFWKRSSVGVGDLTTHEMVDPNFPGCDWELPPGSADPYSMQFKAIASLGDGCPTLDLPYAAPLNMVTNHEGLPIDKNGKVIDAANNPRGLPQFKDLNGDGDLFDDTFLRDWRFKPMPHPEATKKVDRYSVVIPPGTKGPIAVSTAVYYQSVEAVVALKFLGNMTDTNGNFVLETCTLNGRCDGRKPSVEPAVVEGAPAVPMVVRNTIINLGGEPAAPPAPVVAADGTVAPAPGKPAARIATYPAANADRVYQDVVVKAFFSKPMKNVDGTKFALFDSKGAPVPAWVDQIGDGTYGLFANDIRLKGGETYTAKLGAGICDAEGTCTPSELTWSFRVAAEADQGRGDTSVPSGFSARYSDWPQPPAPEPVATKKMKHGGKHKGAKGAHNRQGRRHHAQRAHAAH